MAKKKEEQTRLYRYVDTAFRDLGRCVTFRQRYAKPVCRVFHSYGMRDSCTPYTILQVLCEAKHVPSIRHGFYDDPFAIGTICPGSRQFVHDNRHPLRIVIFRQEFLAKIPITVFHSVSRYSFRRISVGHKISSQTHPTTKSKNNKQK